MLAALIVPQERVIAPNLLAAETATLIVPHAAYLFQDIQHLLWIGAFRCFVIEMSSFVVYRRCFEKFGFAMKTSQLVPASRVAILIESEMDLALTLKSVLDDRGCRAMILPALPDVADLRRLRPDFIFLDLKTQAAKHEISFLEQMRQDPETFPIHIIVTSGWTVNGDPAQTAAFSLADDVLMKPFSLEAFERAVDSVCGAQEAPVTLSRLADGGAP